MQSVVQTKTGLSMYMAMTVDPSRQTAPRGRQKAYAPLRMTRNRLRMQRANNDAQQ